MNRLQVEGDRFFWDGKEVTLEQARNLYKSNPGEDQQLPGASALPYEEGGNAAIGAKNVALNAWDNLRQRMARGDEAELIQHQSDLRNERYENLQQTDMGAGTGWGEAAAIGVPMLASRGYLGDVVLGGSTNWLAQNRPEALDFGLGAATAAGGRWFSDQILGRIGNVMAGNKPIDTPEAAQREASGYWQSPGQMKGDQVMLQDETRGVTNPWINKPLVEGEKNLKRLEARLNESMGNPPDAGTLNRKLRTETADRLGKELDDAVADASNINISDDLAARMQKLNADAWTEVPLPPEGGVIDGPTYKTLRQSLRAARDRTSDGDKAGYIGDTLRQLDEEFEKAVPDANVKAYRVAREHYKNLSMAEEGRALSGGGEINLETMQGKFASDRGYGKRSLENTLPETRKLIEDMEALTGRQNAAYLGKPQTATASKSKWNPAATLDAMAWGPYFNYPGLMAARDPMVGNLGAAGGAMAGQQLPPGLLDPLGLTSR